MSARTSNLPEADVIVDSAPSTGRFNMAMDAALLALGEQCERSVVRIYQWSEPTVTLGYFQNGTSSEESPFPQLPCVRRLTGGGAILHDRELTYSCVVPAFHRVRSIYAAMGIDPSKELYDGDRPVPITDHGKPIARLFGS